MALPDQYDDSNFPPTKERVCADCGEHIVAHRVGSGVVKLGVRDYQYVVDALHECRKMRESVTPRRQTKKG